MQIDVGSGVLLSVGTRRVRERRVCVLRECHKARIANCRTQKKRAPVGLLRTSFHLNANPIRHDPAAPLPAVGCVMQGHAGIPSWSLFGPWPLSVPASTRTCSKHAASKHKDDSNGTRFTGNFFPQSLAAVASVCLSWNNYYGTKYIWNPSSQWRWLLLKCKNHVF